MEITINNKPEFFSETLTVRELLAEKKYKRASVWINGTQLKKAEYDTFELKDGDVVKILRLVSGG